MKRTIKKKKYSKKKYSRKNNSIKRNVNKTKRKSIKRNINKTKKKSIKKSIKKKNLKGGSGNEDHDHDDDHEEEERKEKNYEGMSRVEMIQKMYEMKEQLAEAGSFGSAMTAQLAEMEQLKDENASLIEVRDQLEAKLEEVEWENEQLNDIKTKLGTSVTSNEKTITELKAKVQKDEDKINRLNDDLLKVKNSSEGVDPTGETNVDTMSTQEPVPTGCNEIEANALEEEAQLRRQAEQSAKKLAAQLATQLQLFETERAQEEDAAAQVKLERDAAARKALEQAGENTSLKAQITELEQQIERDRMLNDTMNKDYISGASLLDELGEGEVSDSTVNEQAMNDTIFLQRIMEILNLQVRETKSQSERYAEFNELTQNFDTIAKKIESGIEEL